MLKKLNLINELLIMKLFKNIGLLAVLMLLMVSCIDKTPDYGNFPTKDVDFTYNVDGDQFLLDFYVVSTIQFTNTSAKPGAVTWDFGDGETSTDVNPLHMYKEAGIYKVKLTVDGVGSRTYPLMIYDIAPVLSVKEQSDDPVVINDVTVALDIFLPNPENKKCKYTWIFPEGTTNVAGEKMTTWIGFSHEDGSVDLPGTLKFSNIGSQKIELQTVFDFEGSAERRLDDAYANVQVGCNYPCKTIYYAVLDGNIKAYKLVDMSKVPAGTKVGAFDMGVKSGSMPTQLIYKKVKEQDLIYILDCGKQYTYIDDANALNGDGKINVMSVDGKSTNIMVTNVGKQAFNDPFQGCTDNQYMYYTDRNTGIRRMDLTVRGGVETSDFKTEIGYMVTNQQLGYYGRGIGYGAIHTDIALDSRGVFWWAKNFGGVGIYRFKTSDIGKLNTAPYHILLSGANPRAFALDEKNKQMYVWLSKGKPGLCVYDLPGDDDATDKDAYKTYIPMDADPINTTADEGVYTTQFAIDSETGNVFFGFRANKLETKYTTGLKYYDPAKKEIVDFNENKEKILGVAVCDTPTKLF